MKDEERKNKKPTAAGLKFRRHTPLRIYDYKG